MKSIDLFYQCEGVGEIGHIELEPEATFSILRNLLADKHGVSSDAMLFLEDEENPIDEAVRLKDYATAKGLKVHLHRCRHIEVTVAFNNETVERRFAPGTTVARVKRWAAERKFGMSHEEAGEHVLQIAGTHNRPAPGTHIGALTDGKVCTLAFDLVADERVNGASEADG